MKNVVVEPVSCKSESREQAVEVGDRASNKPSYPRNQTDRSRTTRLSRNQSTTTAFLHSYHSLYSREKPMAIRTHSDKRHSLLLKAAKQARKTRDAQKSASLSKSAGLRLEAQACERDLDATLGELEQLERLMGGECPAQSGLFD
jgi:hypothetical protein